MTQNLSERLKETSSKYAGQVAIQHKKDGNWEQLSYKSLWESVERVALFLSEQGIRKGDKITILLENRPEWPIIFFSAVSVGAIPVLFHPKASSSEIRNILIDSECKLTFVSEHSVLPDGMNLKDTAYLNKQISVDSEEFKNATTVQPGRAVSARPGREDVACILYTSGTTSKPKGVMLSHGNLSSNCDALHTLGLMKRSDKIFAALPLYDSYPLMVTMLLPLFYGNTVCYPGTLQWELVFKAIAESDSTAFVGVPQVFHHFYQRIEEGVGKIPFPLNILIKITAEILYVIIKENQCVYLLAAAQNLTKKPRGDFLNTGLPY